MSGGSTRRLERRRLLGLLGTTGIVAGAGCIGDFGTGSDNGDDGDNGSGGESSGRTFEPTIDHPGDDPVEFTDDQNCPVCNMTPAEYSRWQGQVAHEDGTGAAFDTPGCLFAYVAAPESDAEIVGAWTTDYETRELIDATEAHFVLITDADAADDPMSINPRTFADEDDALEFLEEWDAEELSEDDIIGFDEIDLDAAALYRGNRL